MGTSLVCCVFCHKFKVLRKQRVYNRYKQIPVEEESDEIELDAQQLQLENDEAIKKSLENLVKIRQRQYVNQDEDLLGKSIERLETENEDVTVTLDSPAAFFNNEKVEKEETKADKETSTEEQKGNAVGLTSLSNVK